MKTEILKTKRGTKKIVEKIYSVLINGWLVAFPTETVYGLWANALDEEACKKIYKAKWRPSDNPLIIHISKAEDIKKYGFVEFSYVEKLIKKFWPWPLTLIVKKKKNIGTSVSWWLDTVAIRFPKHTLALKIIEKCWFPIAAPSANSSWKPSPTIAESVIQDLDGKIDIIVDGGTTQVWLESTVLDVTWKFPVILRHGSITKEMLQKIVPEIKNTMNEEQKKKSPWTRYKHYSPETPVKIVTKTQRESIINDIKKYKNACYVWIRIKESNDFIFSFSSKKTLAKHLYSTLRKCDTYKIETIYIEEVNEKDIGKALMNRISKSAWIL